jgi:hypothetical protein
MHKLIVGHLVTLDGCCEGRNRNLKAIFEYVHTDDASDQHSAYRMAERIRAADTLLLSGRGN